MGSGKDYRSDKLVAVGNVRRHDFKDELLAMVSDIAGYDVRKDYSWFKEHPVGVMRPKDPLQEAFLRSEWNAILAKYPGIITGRDLLQRVGTEAIRSRQPEYWVNAFLKAAGTSLTKGVSVVNADCRFFNEIEAIQGFHSEGGIPYAFIFCNFKSPRYNPSFNHASEKLAQTLLKMGLVDGEVITDYQFNKAAKIMGEKYERPD
jgi:hypothetical protein